MSYRHLPHLTKLTSRAALSQGDDGLGSTLSSQSDSDVKQLHDLVGRSLGDFKFEICQTGTRQRKLNNTSMEVDPEPTDTLFRLISWTLPARSIHLFPVHHSSVGHRRFLEDTVGEAQLRQLRAQEVAVDTDRILGYTCTSSSKAILTASDTLIPVVAGTNPSDLPSLLVTEHRSTILSAPKVDESKTGHCRVKCCPVVPLTDQSLSDKPKRRRRRRFPVRDRLPPAFFRPMQERGGESEGCAIGWRGNQPADRMPRRYARDKMRKGTLRQSGLDRSYVTST